MSNVLRRKSKKMQPLGYSERELAGIQNYAKNKRNTDFLIEESFLNLQLIAFQILHDKFGFGNRRIIKVENIISEYLKTTASGGLSTEQLQYFMKEKCGIDVKVEANKVPFRERFSIIERKVAASSMQSAGTYLAASICNYFSLIGVCLKKNFGFSKNKITEVFGWIRYYINSLATGYETLTGVASVLFYECNYSDQRYADKVYEI